jgi:hypothetical protein
MNQLLYLSTYIELRTKRFITLKLALMLPKLWWLVHGDSFLVASGGLSE